MCLFRTTLYTSGTHHLVLLTVSGCTAVGYGDFTAGVASKRGGKASKRKNGKAAPSATGSHAVHVRPLKKCYILCDM